MRLLGGTIERQTKMKDMTLTEWMIIAVIVGLLGLIAAPTALKLTGVPIHYSDGDRTGVVVKISKKGLIWKTWEGQMNLGSMSTDGNGVAVPSTFLFSVTDDAVVKQIQAAAKNASRITLHYDQPLVLPFSKGESGYLITSTDYTNK